MNIAKFTYPRELTFYHDDYQVGCAGTETPFIGGGGKTYLYVWNKVKKNYAYYCFEEDLFHETSTFDNEDSVANSSAYARLKRS